MHGFGQTARVGQSLVYVHYEGCFRIIQGRDRQEAFPAWETWFRALRRDSSLGAGFRHRLLHQRSARCHIAGLLCP